MSGGRSKGRRAESKGQGARIEEVGSRSQGQTKQSGVRPALGGKGARWEGRKGGRRQQQEAVGSWEEQKMGR